MERPFPPTSPARNARPRTPGRRRALVRARAMMLLAVLLAAAAALAPRPADADGPDGVDAPGLPAGGPASGHPTGDEVRTDLLAFAPWDELADAGGAPSPPPAACTLELCCARVDAVLFEGWRCWTRCTRTEADGTTTTTACRAGPTGLFRDLGHGDLPDCANWTLLDGAWGPIDTYCGPWDATHPDWGLATTTCVTVRTPGTGCDTCGCVAETMRRIEDCCVRFELLPELYGYNENSAVATALHECGVLGPLADLAQANPEWGAPVHHLLKSIPGFPEHPLDFGTPGWSSIIPLDCDR